MVLFQSSFAWCGPPSVASLLHLASAIYGIGVIVLVALFAFTDMSAMIFAKMLTPQLFVIGSVLCVDGGLALRSVIDRSYERLRFGKAAIGFGATKIAAGALALFLVVIGVVL